MINVLSAKQKNETQPYECVVRFIQQALIEIGEEKAKELEKELMELVCKYKYVS